MKRLFLLTIVLTMLVGSASAQFGSQWRKLREEVIFGVGTTNFMGELGGADQVGTHYARDFEFSFTRPVFSAGYRYKLNKSFSTKGLLSFGMLYGDDATTAEIHRNSRNLSFRSPILELGGHIEYHIIKEKFGHRYDLRRNRGKSNTPSLYIFTGVNGIWFNPKAQYQDEWVALQPLGTEGQGRVDTREPYSRISMSFPVGFGMNFLMDRNLGVGFEWGVRYAITDYMDDVSTTYVDPELFGDDEVARALADRSKNDWPGSTPYSQRGNSNYNDAYMFLTINVTYKLRPSGPGMPKF
ncbi:MAG: DUF6089 family protein [Bacteroidota bacterium]